METGYASSNDKESVALLDKMNSKGSFLSYDSTETLELMTLTKNFQELLELDQQRNATPASPVSKRTKSNSIISKPQFLRSSSDTLDAGFVVDDLIQQVQAETLNIQNGFANGKESFIYDDSDQDSVLWKQINQVINVDKLEEKQRQFIEDDEEVRMVSSLMKNSKTPESAAIEINTSKKRLSMLFASLFDPGSPKARSPVHTNLPKINRDVIEKMLPSSTPEESLDFLIGEIKESMAMNTASHNPVIYIESPEFFCPICNAFKSATLEELNDHVEGCLAEEIQRQETNTTSDSRSRSDTKKQAKVQDIDPEWEVMTKSLHQGKKPQQLVEPTEHKLKFRNNFMRSSMSTSYTIQKDPIVLGGVPNEGQKISYRFSKGQRSKRVKLCDSAEKYKLKIQEILNNSLTQVLALKSKEAALRLTIQQDVSKYNGWASTKLKRSFCRIAQCQIVRSHLLQERESMKIEVLNQKLRDINNIIFKVKENVPIVEIYQDAFVSVKVLFNQPKFEKNALMMKKLESDRNFLFQKFAKLRDREKLVNEEARGKALNKMIDSATINDNYVDHDDAIQNEFDLFICDQRYREGKQIQKLCESLRDDKSKGNITAEDVLDFLDQLSSTVGYKYKLDGVGLAKLQLLLSRTILALISEFTSYFTQKTPITESYANFIPNVVILKAKPIKQLYTELCPLFAPNLQEHSLDIPIQLLEDLMFESVPRDMTQLINQVLAFIYDLGYKITGKGVGADELFPLFVTCVALAENAHLSFCINFLHHFLLPNEKLGESGYSLVTLEAAVAYISSLNLNRV